jgi:hypothetical protein
MKLKYVRLIGNYNEPNIVFIQQWKYKWKLETL